MIQYNDSIDQQLLLLRKNLREKCFDCYSSRKNKLKNDAIFVVCTPSFQNISTEEYSIFFSFVSNLK